VSRGKDKRTNMEIHRAAQGAPAPPPAIKEAGLESDIQAHLGRQLRAIYDEVAAQPVPDRFLKLLQQLEQKTAKPASEEDS
jgi:hypothetical protein